MQITPVAAVATASELETFVAHELFHCYQGIWLGLDRYYYEQGGSWAIEGSATWAGYNSPPSRPASSANWYYQYVASASTPLFAREHDAVGFFGQVAQRGVDLWPLMKQLIQTSGDVPRYRVSPTPPATTSSTAGDPATGPRRAGRTVAHRRQGCAAARRVLLTHRRISVGNGASVSLQESPYTVGLYTGSPTAEVTEVKVTGHARLADTGSFDTNDLTDTFLCTKTDGACTCPSDNDDTNGSNGLPASIQQVSPPLIMGVTGATDGSKGAVVGMSLDTWCKSRNKKKATTACQVLDVAELDAITGLHITKVKDDGNGASMQTRPHRRATSSRASPAPSRRRSRATPSTSPAVPAWWCDSGRWIRVRIPGSPTSSTRSRRASVTPRSWSPGSTPRRRSASES